jgi:hypothetical protein
MSKIMDVQAGRQPCLRERARPATALPAPRFVLKTRSRGRALTQSTTRSHGRDGSAAPKPERNVFLGAHCPLATAAPRVLPAVASHAIG